MSWVVGQNDGLQRKDYARFQTYTCKAQAGTEADVLAKQEDSAAKNGQRYVDEVRDKLVSLGLSLKDSVPGFDGAHFYGGYDDETV